MADETYTKAGRIGWNIPGDDAEYDPEYTYERLDICRYNDKMYALKKTASRGNAPSGEATDNEYWMWVPTNSVVDMSKYFPKYDPEKLEYPYNYVVEHNGKLYRFLYDDPSITSWMPIGAPGEEPWGRCWEPIDSVSELFVMLSQATGINDTSENNIGDLNVNPELNVIPPTDPIGGLSKEPVTTRISRIVSNVNTLISNIKTQFGVVNSKMAKAVLCRDLDHDSEKDYQYGDIFFYEGEMYKYLGQKFDNNSNGPFMYLGTPGDHPNMWEKVDNMSDVIRQAEQYKFKKGLHEIKGDIIEHRDFYQFELIFDFSYLVTTTNTTNRHRYHLQGRHISSRSINSDISVLSFSNEKLRVDILLTPTDYDTYNNAYNEYTISTVIAYIDGTEIPDASKYLRVFYNYID